MTAIRFGLNCYRNNPLHFQERSHPASHPALVKHGIVNPASASTQPVARPRRERESARNEMERERVSTSEERTRQDTASSASNTSSRQNAREDKKEDGHVATSRCTPMREGGEDAAVQPRAGVANAREERARSGELEVNNCGQTQENVETPVKRRKLESPRSNRERITSQSVGEAVGSQQDQGLAPAREDSEGLECITGSVSEQKQAEENQDRRDTQIQEQEKNINDENAISEERAQAPDVKDINREVEPEKIVEKEILPLNLVSDMSSLSEGAPASRRSIAFPLLCCCPILKCEPRLAARVAMQTIKKFLDSHAGDKKIKLYLICDDDKNVMEALQQESTFSDERFVVVSSSDAQAIVSLGQHDASCRSLVVETDKLFVRGKRPSRGDSSSPPLPSPSSPPLPSPPLLSPPLPISSCSLPPPFTNPFP
eukprot:467868-Hanusia_phi.AAC.2